MPFKFNPPTRVKCEVCELLHNVDEAPPIIDSHSGKASSANKFPFHNWYNFVLGYSPQFPQYMIERENILPTDLVADPFMGSGTTLVCCKMQQIPSLGIDANDFMVDTASTKLDWDVDISLLKSYADEVLSRVRLRIDSYDWEDKLEDNAIDQLSFLLGRKEKSCFNHYLERRPEMLVERYISNKPLAKAYIIQDVIESVIDDKHIRKFIELALLSIIVPISNVRYGPGFGVIKPKNDVDVAKFYTAKLRTMIRDLEQTKDSQRTTPSVAVLGDARNLSQNFAPNSVTLMITSPPYPGDHEYTKHTRLELIFKGYARNNDEFRTIKKRMLRGSTTNIYSTDNDRESVNEFENIKRITDLISERLEHDGATSGFEKLYTKLIWEYFGGMHKTLIECLKVLKPGGKIALLVSDSHAFKMVHIQTAEILKEIGQSIGFTDAEIILWQLKTTTSHSYNLRENVLVLSKPLS